MALTGKTALNIQCMVPVCAYGRWWFEQVLLKAVKEVLRGPPYKPRVAKNQLFPQVRTLKEKHILSYI